MDTIYYLNNMEDGYLDISYLGLKKLPKSPKWEEVTKLKCQGNNLEHLPSMPNLKYLNCNNNQLKQLPPMLNIKKLKCQSNQLKHLPELPKITKGVVPAVMSLIVSPFGLLSVPKIHVLAATPVCSNLIRGTALPPVRCKIFCGLCVPIPTLFEVLMKMPVPVCLEFRRIPPPSVVLVEISRSPTVPLIRESTAKTEDDDIYPRANKPMRSLRNNLCFIRVDYKI